MCLGEGQRPQGTLRVVPRLSPPRRLSRHSPTALLVRRHGAEALVEVLDSGCVAEEEIPRLFDRFHRGKRARLAIAESIARRHDLAIGIENRSDRSGLRVSVSRGPAARALIRP